MTQNHRLLITFDALMDTRLPVLETINPEARRIAYANDDYWWRDYNDWPRLTGGLVTNEQFAEAWAKRDNDTRWRSVMSNILAPLLKILTDYNFNMRDNIEDRDITLEFNIWPYEFVDDEVLAVEEHLRQLFGAEYQYSFVSIPLEELTPVFLTSHYDLAVMYEFQDWFRTHVKALYEHRAHRFTMVIPKLFEVNPKSLTVEQKQKEMQRFKMQHLEFMSFEFIDAKCFSQFKP